MSKLLLDEKPLLVMPSLATKVGLSEAIFLQQLHYWLDRSVNVEEGHKWVYNTAKEWQGQFPFWSINTIRRVIKSLEDKQLVISGNFNSLPIDKTKWYRIDYEKIKEIEDGDVDSRKVESTTQSEYSKHPKQVIEAPNLGRPLPESTTESTSEITNNNNNNNVGAEEEKEIPETPFSFYEKNGFGILTPHVGEKIGSWIDDTNEELVIHAMKISVENGVLRWNYTETILRDWHNKKIASIDQVVASEKKREQAKASVGKRNHRPGREEKTPEWFGKDKPKKVVAATPVKSKEEVDAERAALIRELQGES